MLWCLVEELGGSDPLAKGGACEGGQIRWSNEIDRRGCRRELGVRVRSAFCARWSYWIICRFLWCLQKADSRIFGLNSFSLFMGRSY